jgi:hypothetical protein
MEQNFACAVERSRHDEAAVTVVKRGDAERWEKDRSGRLFLDGLERMGSSYGAKDAADVGEQGGAVENRLR